MLTDIQMRNVRENKSHNAFTPDFIREFDKEWSAVQELFKGCKADLGKIHIGLKEK